MMVFNSFLNEYQNTAADDYDFGAKSVTERPSRFLTDK